MFKTRLASGIILVLVLIALVGHGGYVLLGFLAAVSLIGMYELYKVVNVQNKILGFADVYKRQIQKAGADMMILNESCEIGNV